MWDYNLDIWPWRSPRLSATRVLVLCQSTKYKFSSMAHTGQTYQVTLIFNLGGHGAWHWCGSTSSIHIPTLKFLGLTARKIWRILCVCVSRPVLHCAPVSRSKGQRSGSQAESACDLDLWPFDLETGAQCSMCHGVPSCQFWWYYDYSFSIYGPLG